MCNAGIDHWTENTGVESSLATVNWARTSQYQLICLTGFFVKLEIPEIGLDKM